jgi:hypothetical protein
VVVPVNPMNRAEELKHYITDPDAKVAITTGDLAASSPRRARAAAEQRLAHMVVTQFTDAFDADVSGDDAPAGLARLAGHAAPAARAGRRQDAGLDRRAGRRPAAAARARRGRQRPGLLPYTSGTTGLPKGCMHTTQPDAQRGGQARCGAASTSESVVLAVVPMFHITGMVSMMHTADLAAPRWSSCRAGTATGRPADLALEGHALDQHPDHGDRPDGQPQLRELRPEQPGTTSAAAARPCRRPWRSACGSSTACVLPKATASPKPPRLRTATRRRTPSSNAWAFRS